MSQGFILRNQQGELVVHRDSLGTQCIGRATLTQLVQPVSASDGSRTAGYSSHRFDSTRPILWAFDLPVGRRVGVVSVGYANGVNTLSVYCGANPDGRGFDQQFAVDVWAFSTLAPDTVGAGRGLRLRNSSGVLSHDFSVPNLTLPLAAGDLTTPAQLPAIVRPVAIGSSPYYDVQYETDEVNYFKTDRRQFLLRAADNTVAYSPGLIYRSGAMTGNPPPGSTITDPSPFFVIDGQFLP